jgi:hypothetical protein
MAHFVAHVLLAEPRQPGREPVDRVLVRPSGQSRKEISERINMPPELLF